MRAPWSQAMLEALRITNLQYHCWIRGYESAHRHCQRLDAIRAAEAEALFADDGEPVPRPENRRGDGPSRHSRPLNQLSRQAGRDHQQAGTGRTLPVADYVKRWMWDAPALTLAVCGAASLIMSNGLA